MAFVIKVNGYNDDAKKLFNKNFTNVPDSAKNDESAQRKLVNKFGALTAAASLAAQRVVTTDIDLA